MTYDPGKGALFKNMKKTEPRHCDYRGEVNIGGQSFWITAWLRTAKSGEKYMALTFQAKDEQPEERRPAMALSRDNMDDDIPF
jgi:hypothetical protein